MRATMPQPKKSLATPISNSLSPALSGMSKVVFSIEHLPSGSLRIGCGYQFLSTYSNFPLILWLDDKVGNNRFACKPDASVCNIAFQTRDGKCGPALAVYVGAHLSSRNNQLDVIPLLFFKRCVALKMSQHVPDHDARKKGCVLHGVFGCRVSGAPGPEVNTFIFALILPAEKDGSETRIERLIIEFNRAVSKVLVITQNFVLAHFLPPRSGLLNLVVGATHDSYHYFATVAERRLKHTPSQQTYSSS